MTTNDSQDLKGWQEEPPEDSWQTIAEITGLQNPLFDRTLFALGYDFTSNVYIIQGDYLSIIDPGNDYLIFMELFRERGLDPTRIKKIALTHGHVDHAMATMEFFRGYPGYQGKIDLEVILHEAGPLEFKELLKQAGVKITEVVGGETINLSGMDLEVIHTPGHTLDGACYYHAPTKTLFTGDTVLPEAMADMDQGAGGRLDHYMYSLRTLRKLEVDHILPGHGGLAPLVGRRVLADTYDGLIQKALGENVPTMEGAGTMAQNGNLEEALFLVNKELANTPDHPRALEFKAFLLNDLGRNEEALPVFDQLLEQPKIHPYLLVGKGCALLGLGRYEESLLLFDRVISENPQVQEAQVYKGMALYLSGRPEEAMEIEAFRREFTDRLQQELEPKAGTKT